MQGVESAGMQPNETGPCGYLPLDKSAGMQSNETGPCGYPPPDKTEWEGVQREHQVSNNDLHERPQMAGNHSEEHDTSAHVHNPFKKPVEKIERPVQHLLHPAAHAASHHQHLQPRSSDWEGTRPEEHDMLQKEHGQTSTSRDAEGDGDGAAGNDRYQGHAQEGKQYKEYDVTSPNLLKKLVQKAVPVAPPSANPAHAVTDEDRHHRVEDIAEPVAHAVIKEIFYHLAQDRELNTLANVTATQGVIMAKIAQSDDARRAAQITAYDAFQGSYDAYERRWHQWLQHKPAGIWVAEHTYHYAIALGLGLLLCVWRFVFFGLAPFW